MLDSHLVLVTLYYNLQLSKTIRIGGTKSIANERPLDVPVKGHLMGPYGNAGQWHGMGRCRASGQVPQRNTRYAVP
jgi:hypothetical protein